MVAYTTNRTYHGDIYYKPYLSWWHTLQTVPIMVAHTTNRTYHGGIEQGAVIKNTTILRTKLFNELPWASKW